MRPTNRLNRTKEILQMRVLSESEKSVIETLYQRKANFEPIRGYVTTVAPVETKEWNGNHFPTVEANMKTVIIPPGQTMQIVMVSRFGDCGLTADLKTDLWLRGPHEF